MSFSIRTRSLFFSPWAFTDRCAGFRHPGTRIFYAVDYAVGRVNLPGDYLTAVPVHGLDAFPVCP